MTKPKLTNDDFCRASKRLRCGVAEIKAVAEVESRGEGFYPDGFPVILFERHKFRSFTKGRFNNSHPHLSGPAGGYGKAGQNQRNKFNEAFELAPEAAMKSCSWGKFQIMGFNHDVCGYSTVGAFVDAMKESEGKQLDAFVSFVIGNGLADELRGKKWAAFARSYNGPDYAKNKYDTKMATAYAKFAKENIDCSKASTAHTADSPAQSHVVVKPTDNTLKQNEAQSEPSSPQQTQIAENIVNAGPAPLPPPEDKDVPAPTKDGATSDAAKMTIAGIVVPGFIVAIIKTVQDLVAQGYVSASEVGATVLGFIRDNQKYVFLLIGLLILLLIVKKMVKQITFWIEMLTKAIPGWNNITVVPTETVPVVKKWWEVWR